MSDELSAARRVMRRLSPRAFLEALDPDELAALVAVFREQVASEPSAFAWGLTTRQRHDLRQALNDAIQNGCTQSNCRENVGRRSHCDEHAAENAAVRRVLALQEEATARELAAARPRRTHTPGPNGCCYVTPGHDPCHATGTENVNGAAACEAHARQLPGPAERRAMRPYT